MLHQILILAVVLMTISWQSVTPAAGSLTVAWVEYGDLLVWHQGDSAPAKIASGDIQAAFLAPDGEHIVYLRNFTTPSESLWVIARDGSNNREITVDKAPDELVTGYIAWLDASTFYFNTIRGTDAGAVYSDDLWRADVTTATAQQLLPPGEGGRFTISPDKRHIVLVRPGVYDSTEGQISLINPDGGDRQELLSFPAVSTGAEYLFYPLIFWQADSSAFHVAIPDKDLIYNESSGMTTLWRLGIDGSQQQLGNLQASFFTQPQWSSDGNFVVYARRVGEADSNQFEIATASGDGSGATAYTAGLAGALQLLGWLPDANQFLYAQGEFGMFWLGIPGEPPQALPGRIFMRKFITDSSYLYVDLSTNPLELRYTDLHHPGISTLLTTVDVFFLNFDAVLVP
jgi:hypothetical protein